VAEQVNQANQVGDVNHVKPDDNAPEGSFVALSARVQALELHREYENRSLTDIQKTQAEVMGKVDMLVSGMQAAASDQADSIHRVTQQENRVTSIELWRGETTTIIAVMAKNVENYIANEAERRRELKEMMNTLVNRWGFIIGALGLASGIVLHYFK
jgi:hypothetical protein